MTNLPLKFKNPNPSLSERRVVPTEAMEFWSRETWASWLVDGIRIFDHGNREDRVLAFAPLTLDPDFGEAADLFPQLKSAVTAPTMLRFEEGLSSALAAWCGEDGARSASFLIQLAGFVEGVGPRTALKAMLQKPISFHLLPNAADIANSIAFVLSRRGDSPLIRELKITLAPILSTSWTAAVLVAAREAVDDVSDFVRFLEQTAGGLFDLPAEHPDWHFVVNQLVERAGVERAVEAAYLDKSRDTTKLREALHLYRLAIPNAVERPGYRTVFDRFRKQTYEVSTRYFSKGGDYFYQVEKALFPHDMGFDSPWGGNVTERFGSSVMLRMSVGVGNLLDSDVEPETEDALSEEEKVVEDSILDEITSGRW